VKILTDAEFIVRDTPKLREEAKRVVGQWLRSLISNLDAQFPRADVIRSLTALFDPSCLPETSSAQFQQHGVEALHILKQFYCPSVES
jgi:hypothetical protein